MALLTSQRVTLAGTQITYAAASAGGDTFAPDVAELRVKNGHTAAQSVTIVTPGTTQWGVADPDIVVSVPAGAEYAIGPFPRGLADPSDNLVHVTYSGTTALTVALVAF